MSVYFIQAEDGGPIKIGLTNGDPVARLRSLQTASAEPLDLLFSIPRGDATMEQFFHRHFAEGRLGSGEWFDEDTPGLAEFIEAIIAPDTSNPDVVALHRLLFPPLIREQVEA